MTYFLLKFKVIKWKNNSLFRKMMLGIWGTYMQEKKVYL